MNRYFILTDGAGQFNQATMAQIEADKANNWKVTDAVSVRLKKNADGSVQETNDPTDVPACRIVLS